MATVGSMCIRTASNISKNFTNLMLQRNSQSCCQHLRHYSGTTEPNGKQQEGKTPVTETEIPETKSEQSVPENDSAMKELQEKLTKQVNDYKDKHLRALAETENVRARMTKQVSDMKKFGIQGFCKDLLEVADILNKATESVPKEELNDKNPHLLNLFNGLTMTEQQLQKVFSKHGLQKIEPKTGEVFDPNVHEALFQVPTTNSENDSQIADIQKVGYKLHERTIRPALVGVFKA